MSYISTSYCNRHLYVGSLHRAWIDSNGFLLQPNIMSLSLYASGILVFEFSEISVWPIYLTINKLPCGRREKGKILLHLVQLFFQPSKPSGKSFCSESEKYCFTAPSTSASDPYIFPRRNLFKLRNRKKFLRVRSGEYGGCGSNLNLN